MGNNAISTNIPIPDTIDPLSGQVPIRWWQWVLVYPALAITVMSALPTWVQQVQAVRLGVTRGDVPNAEEQNKLWQKNLKCAKAQEIQRIRTSRNTEIGAQVCPSGHVLLLLS